MSKVSYAVVILGMALLLIMILPYTKFSCSKQGEEIWSPEKDMFVAPFCNGCCLDFG